MANNPYVNKVVKEGTTLIDLSTDTALAADVASGKYFHLATGERVQGTASGGGGGAVIQDQNGYLVLSDQGGGDSVIVDPLSVTQNGTYTALSGHAYSPVTVNVSGGVTPTPTPTPWVRPSDWPDLSKMDVSGDNIVYMTYYADEDKGFCNFRVDCTGNYTVDVGYISGTSFITESSHDYASTTYCSLYFGTANGTYKVLRVTGTAITQLRFSYSNTVTINGFNGYSGSQGVIDIVGKLSNCTSLYFSTLYNLINVEISDVKPGDMTNIFNGCYSLASLDVSSWDVSNVAYMNNAFDYCYSLTSLDVSDWNTSNALSMNTTFGNCASLVSLDVSGFNTSKVTNMGSMFTNCCSLKSLDAGDWNTSKVTNMSNMFASCQSLASLDVSGWNTSSVTNMNSMFGGCKSLPSLDVSGWNTSNVTNMGSMFSSCYALQSLDVSDWDTSNVTSMSSMFSSCYALKSLDVSDWDVSSVTNMDSMFYTCASIQSLDVSGWDFSGITTANNATSIFRGCRSIKGSLSLPSSMAFIGTYCFADNTSLEEWHFAATTPPTLASSNAFDRMTNFGGKKIYVPAASLSAYQTANNWSTYASYMVGE